MLSDSLHQPDNILKSVGGRSIWFQLHTAIIQLGSPVGYRLRITTWFIKSLSSVFLQVIQCTVECEECMLYAARVKTAFGECDRRTPCVIQHWIRRQRIGYSCASQQARNGKLSEFQHQLAAENFPSHHTPTKILLKFRVEIVGRIQRGKFSLLLRLRDKPAASAPPVRPRRSKGAVSSGHSS